MNVSKVSVVNPKVENMKKAGKVAVITGGLAGASSVASEVLFNKALAKRPKDDMIEVFSGLSKNYGQKLKESLKTLKSLENIEEIKIPKSFNKITENIEKYMTPKRILKAENEAKEILDNLNTGKINYKPIAKRALKNAGITALVVGGVYLLGKTISDAVKNKKAEKTTTVA